MGRSCRAIGSALFVWIFLGGCAGNSHLTTGTPAAGCSGVVISGTLRDSLTFQPVSQGMAILESGTQLGATSSYHFRATQKVATDAQGAFSLCAQSTVYPTVMLLEAMDAGGKAYPPYVTLVTGASDMGIVSMGGCILACGIFDAQQQTASPATITGTITSAPMAVTGDVIPRYALRALDGSKTQDGVPNVWGLAMPVFSASTISASMISRFSTVVGACDGASPYCARYTLTVPAQSPMYPVSGGIIQAAVSPTFIVYAEVDSSTACTPPIASTVWQPDGKSPLTATAGAQLTAQSINLTSCH